MSPCKTCNDGLVVWRLYPCVWQSSAIPSPHCEGVENNALPTGIIICTLECEGLQLRLWHGPLVLSVINEPLCNCNLISNRSATVEHRHYLTINTVWNPWGSRAKRNLRRLDPRALLKRFCEILQTISPGGCLWSGHVLSELGNRAHGCDM